MYYLKGVIGLPIVISFVTDDIIFFLEMGLLMICRCSHNNIIHKYKIHSYNKNVSRVTVFEHEMQKIQVTLHSLIR